MACSPVPRRAAPNEGRTASSSRAGNKGAARRVYGAHARPWRFRRRADRSGSDAMPDFALCWSTKSSRCDARAPGSAIRCGRTTWSRTAWSGGQDQAMWRREKRAPRWLAILYNQFANQVRRRGETASRCRRRWRPWWNSGNRPASRRRPRWHRSPAPWSAGRSAPRRAVPGRGRGHDLPGDGGCAGRADRDGDVAPGAGARTPARPAGGRRRQPAEDQMTAPFGQRARRRTSGLCGRRLEPPRRSAVEAYLAERPRRGRASPPTGGRTDCCGRRLRRRRRRTRSRSGCLRLRHRRRSRRDRVRWWRRIVAAVAFVAVGGAGVVGWRTSSWCRRRRGMDLTARATSAHQVYVVEENGPGRGRRRRSRRTCRLAVQAHRNTIDAPGPFAVRRRQLVGGRLLPAAGAAGGAVHVRTRRRPAHHLLHGCQRPTVARPRSIEERTGITALYWLEGSLGYVMVGEADREEMIRHGPRRLRRIRGRNTTAESSRPSVNRLHHRLLAAHVPMRCATFSTAMPSPASARRRRDGRTRVPYCLFMSSRRAARFTVSP